MMPATARRRRSATPGSGFEPQRRFRTGMTKLGGWPTFAAGSAVLLFCLALLIANLVYAGSKLSALAQAPDDRFAADDARILKEDRPPGLVIVGDSRAAQWVRPPRVPGGETLLRGVGGETTVQTEARLADAVRLQPRAILLMSGVNDIIAAAYMEAAERRRVGAEAAARIARMARAAKASGPCVVVATVAPPARPNLLRRLVWRDGIVDDVELLNRRLRDELEGEIPMLDVAAKLPLTSDGHLGPDSSFGTLHFNLSAYLRLNEAAAEALALCPAGLSDGDG